MNGPPPAMGGTRWRRAWAGLQAWAVRWRGRGSPRPGRERWILLDVESSGLDTRRDELLAIAAVGLEVDWPEQRLVLRPGDSLALTLQPEHAPDHANILLHGFGVGRLREGLPPARALQAFLDWSSGAPLVAFHAAFDRALLSRDIRRHLGQPMAHDWLDMAPLCAVSYPQVRARSLDEWLAHFGIACLARHDPAADVLAEGQLLQRIWPRVAAECDSMAAVQRFARRQAWMSGR